MSDAGRRRAQNLKFLYGLSLVKWLHLFHSQGERCAICRTDTPGGRGWQTDHDHVTGRVRAVLCHPCNVGLGSFRDQPTLLNKAARYVEFYRGR